MRCVCVSVSLYNCRRPIQFIEEIAIGVWWCFISLYSSLFCRFVGHFIYALVVFSALSLFILFIILVYVDCSVSCVIRRIKALALDNISFSLFSSSPAHWYTHEHGESSAFNMFVRKNKKKISYDICYSNDACVFERVFFSKANTHRCLYSFVLSLHTASVSYSKIVAGLSLSRL